MWQKQSEQDSTKMIKVIPMASANISSKHGMAIATQVKRAA